MNATLVCKCKALSLSCAVLRLAVHADHRFLNAVLHVVSVSHSILLAPDVATVIATMYLHGSLLSPPIAAAVSWPPQDDNSTLAVAAS